MRKQVSTKPELRFFQSITRMCAQHNCGFWGNCGVCGFNEWLIEMLKNFCCVKTALGHPKTAHERKPIGVTLPNSAKNCVYTEIDWLKTNRWAN